MALRALLLLLVTTTAFADPAEVLAAARARIAAHAAAVDAIPDPAAQAVARADLAFAADAARRGAAAAFASCMDTDGRLFPPRLPMQVGPEAVRALFADDTSLWEWAPVEARASGDLGVTWGVAVISGTGPDGAAYAVTTRYVTAWRRTEDGTWKVWLDAGTPGPLDEVRAAP